MQQHWLTLLSLPCKREVTQQPGRSAGLHVVTESWLILVWIKWYLLISAVGLRIFESYCLKILFIITRSDVMGGASVHLLDLAAALQARNYEVHILAGGTGVLQ